MLPGQSFVQLCDEAPGAAAWTHCAGGDVVVGVRVHLCRQRHVGPQLWRTGNMYGTGSYMQGADHTQGSVQVGGRGVCGMQHVYMGKACGRASGVTCI